jgi:hypothetical protein
VSTLRKKGNAEPLEGIPWGSIFGLLRRLGEKEREGQEEDKSLLQYPAEADLGGAEAQEGKGFHSRSKRMGELGAPLASCAEAAEAPMPSRAVWHGSAGAEDLRETADRPRSRNKALKGEAHERGEPKRAPEDERADTAKRVAKP